MSHVNGDDIDDIFRRASERYPLRTDGADWDRLAADLESDPSLILPAQNVEGEERRKKRFFWLFLLLPLGGLGYYAMQMTGHGAGATRQPAVVSSPSSAAGTSTAGSSAAGTSTAITPDNSNTNTASGTTITPTASGTTAGTNITTPAASGATPAAANGTTASSGGTAVSGATKIANPANSGHFTGPGLLATRSTNPAPSRSFRPGSSQPTTGAGQSTSGAAQPATSTGQSTTASANQPATGAAQRTSGAAQPASDAAQPTAGPLNSPARDPRHFDPFTLQRARTSSGIALNVNVQSRHTPAAAPVPTKLAPKHQTSFYVGLLFAPDLSTIKFQTIKNVGTTYGVLLGYNFNRNWAIESGLYLDRKKYYTQGEYFSTKKISVPANAKISNVDGYCDMWEIPINVRYNFGQGEKMKWFATAGLSTYLMTDEYYSYQFESTTSGNRWPWSKEYNTNSNYLFSVINLSVGYEQRLGKVGNLRLEPYLRVPLAGLGTGSLPIMSAGLNIGITRRIW